jgi:hypothetical protein
LDKVLSSLLSNDDIKDQVQLEVELASYNGEFDYNALTEALKTITVGALSMRRNGDRLGIHLTRDKQSSLPHVLIEWRDIKTSENDVFRTLAGSDGLRMALAAKIIEGHQGKAEQQDGLLRVSLPIE